MIAQPPRSPVTMAGGLLLLAIAGTVVIALVILVVRLLNRPRPREPRVRRAAT